MTAWSSCAGLPGRRQYQKPREPVDHDGEGEQYQSELDERLQIQLAGSFRKFISDHCGDGIARSQKRRLNSWRIADDHRNGHRLAERPRQREEDGSEDARL